MKGFGLRLNKIWQDADYMTDREPVYFALFTVSEADNAAGAAGNDNLCPVPESVRQLTFDDKEQSIYWHYNKLPIQGTTGVSDYLIREVKISGPDISVSADGVVSGYETIEPIGEGETITLKGTQKGGNEKDFTYTVHYGEEKLQKSDGINVRVYEVTNKRTGIVIKKEDWNNNPLRGAVFSLKDESGNEVGTFTSDENGLITTAYLSNGTYYLTETAAPKTYRGLDSSMTITVDGDQITAKYHDKSYDELSQDGMEPPFKLIQAEGDSPATLIVRNRQFGFEAVKVDKDTEAPISRVTFALHEQKTVDGVTGIEVTPMEGYDSLMTNDNGIIPRIDTSLSAGTYELREMNTPPGYAKLGCYIRFTIDPNGTITLDSCPDDVSLTENTDENGTLKYVLKVPNTPVRKVSFKKVDMGNTGKALKGAVFDLYGTDDEGKRLESPIYQGLVSDDNGLLAYKLDEKSYITQFELPGGIYQLVETKAPDGYIVKKETVVVTVNTKSDDSVTYDEGTSLSSIGKGDGKSYDPETKLYTLLITNSTGYMLPATGGPGTKLLYIIGSLMILLGGASMMLWHRRLKKK